MAKYICKRILRIIPVLLVVAVISFFVTHLMPGDPVKLLLGDHASKEQILSMRRQLNLDKPLLTQFGIWFVNMLHGDLGESLFGNQPVIQMIKTRMEQTVLLAIYGQLVGMVIGISLGIIAAFNHGKWADKISIAISLAGISAPSFWVAIMLIEIFAVKLGWLPVCGYKTIAEVGLLGTLKYLVLPGTTIAFMQCGQIARMTRSAMLDILNKEYLRTARATVSSRIALNVLSPEELLLLRFLIGYIFLWVISPNFVKLDSVKEELICLVCGLFGVTLYFYFQNVALLYTVASNVSIINSLSPMFTVILGFIIARSKPSKYFVIGFIISIIGINLVIFSGKIVFDGSLKGNSLALLASIVWGSYSVFIKQLEKYPMVIITRKVFFYGLITMIPILLHTGIEFPLKKILIPEVYLNLVYMGCVASAIGFIIWNRGVKILGPVKTSLYSYAIPIATVIFSVVFLQEVLTVQRIIGGVIVIIGLMISQKV